MFDIFKIINSKDNSIQNEIKMIIKPYTNLYCDIGMVKFILLLWFIFFPIINIIIILFNFNKFNYNFIVFFSLCKNPFLIPIAENSLNTYIYYLKNNRNILNENKLFWNYFFIENNVPTPRILGIINNGIIESKYSNFNNCIIKPIVGSWGIGIEIFNKDNIPRNGKYIIQEKINNNIMNSHFRIVSYFNNQTNKYNILFVYFAVQYDNNKIASNGHSGGTWYEVLYNSEYNKNNYKYRLLSDMNYNKNLSDIYLIEPFNNAINDCLNLHLKINTVLIGWDIKIYNNNYYFLEGNLSPSNIFVSDYYYYDKFTKIKNITY